MEHRIAELLQAALRGLRNGGDLPADFEPRLVVERPRNPQHGDFATPLPLVMARNLRMPPKEAAGMVLAALSPREGEFEWIRYAPPGYINFKARRQAWFDLLAGLYDAPATYGRSDLGQGKRVLLEFVSANPTGPLHVGHGRGAVLGDALARIMRAAGYEVHCEYYVNDVGNQIEALGRSIWARGRELLGLEARLPDNGYRGDYIRDVASALLADNQERLFSKAYEELGRSDDNPVTQFGIDYLMRWIDKTLQKLGVSFDSCFFERELHQSGLLREVVDTLLSQGCAFRDEKGAVLFKMQDEDEEDRVVIRSNGVPTYFAADIAYHQDKLRRGFDHLINIWGADHHGYVSRVKKAIRDLGHDPSVLEVILVQMVALTRGGQVIPMGKRTGEFVTLDEVVDEVGRDAVRFLFLLRKADAQMEFDLELAKRQSMENPVFYVQYGHARVASILRKAAQEGIEPPGFEKGLADGLRLDEEWDIVRHLCLLPSVVATSARRREPHHVAFYLMDTVKAFHSYYTKYRHTEKVIGRDHRKTEARLFLCWCVKHVLARGLRLLGLNAPEEMHYEGPES